MEAMHRATFLDANGGRIPGLSIPFSRDFYVHVLPDSDVPAPSILIKPSK